MMFSYADKNYYLEIPAAQDALREFICTFFTQLVGN